MLVDVFGIIPLQLHNKGSGAVITSRQALGSKVQLLVAARKAFTVCPMLDYSVKCCDCHYKLESPAHVHKSGHLFPTQFMFFIWFFMLVELAC